MRPRLWRGSLRRMAIASSACTWIERGEAPLKPTTPPAWTSKPRLLCSVRSHPAATSSRPLWPAQTSGPTPWRSRSEYQILPLTAGRGSVHCSVDSPYSPPSTGRHDCRWDLCAPRPLHPTRLARPFLHATPGRRLPSGRGHGLRRLGGGLLLTPGPQRDPPDPARSPGPHILALGG